MPIATLRTGVKEMALRVLGSEMVLRRKLERLRKTRALTILNLHQVGPGTGTAYPPLSPELFDYLLTYVKEHFELTTFGELAGLQPDRPAMILSFDDAYSDFLEHAVPLLDKHRVRVNQNVIPYCIETGLPPLNVLVYEFAGRAPDAVLKTLCVPGFDLRPLLADRRALGARLAMYLKRLPMAEQDRLRGEILPQLMKYPEFLVTRMMNAEEVRQIARDHEIGAHSYHHASMEYETVDYLRSDIRACRAFFQAKLGLDLSLYTLPNGSYRPEQIDAIRQEAIPHILLVDEDFSVQDTDLHRRITFDASSRHEVRFRATGAYRWPRRRSPG
jgi:peptidoglycan/xylan/chitin deacetylase (PgdA/CDA1 family)